jgi:hypothetical protein
MLLGWNAGSLPHFFWPLPGRPPIVHGSYRAEMTGFRAGPFASGRMPSYSGEVREMAGVNRTDRAFCVCDGGRTELRRT